MVTRAKHAKKTFAHSKVDGKTEKPGTQLGATVYQNNEVIDKKAHETTQDPNDKATQGQSTPNPPIGQEPPAPVVKRKSGDENLSDREIQQLKAMGATSVLPLEVALSILGISKARWKVIERQQPAALEAWQAGQAFGKYRVAKVYYEFATDGRHPKQTESFLVNAGMLGKTPEIQNNIVVQTHIGKAGDMQRTITLTDITEAINESYEIEPEVKSEA